MFYLSFTYCGRRLQQTDSVLLMIKISISDAEVIQHGLVAVLSGQAGIEQIASGIVPFAQSAVIVHLQLISDYERDISVRKTLLEHDQTSDTAVSILKRVDAFEALMEVYDILEGLPLF